MTFVIQYFIDSMKNILIALLSLPLILFMSCNNDDAAEPTVKIQFTIDKSKSCLYGSEADPDESLALVKIYQNVDDWETGTNPIFSGNPNAKGIIDIGVKGDGIFYYDLQYKGESNWEPNPFLSAGENMNFSWNRNMSLPIQVNARIAFSDDSVLGKYVMIDFLIDGVSTYPDSCKNPDSFIEFRKDFSVSLQQRVNECVDSLGIRAQELFLTKIDCGDIGTGDIQHNSGDVIQNAFQNETIEVINGETVIRNYQNGFNIIRVIYKK
jgi:hypothetical protein